MRRKWNVIAPTVWYLQWEWGQGMPIRCRSLPSAAAAVSLWSHARREPLAAARAAVRWLTRLAILNGRWSLTGRCPAGRAATAPQPDVDRNHHGREIHGGPNDDLRFVFSDKITERRAGLIVDNPLHRPRQVQRVEDDKRHANEADEVISVNFVHDDASMPCQWPAKPSIHRAVNICAVSTWQPSSHSEGLSASMRKAHNIYCAK